VRRLVAVAALGCIACDAVPADQADAMASCAAEEVKEIPISVRQLDLLFVVDRSLSMADEIGHLEEELARTIEVLDGIEGGLPSVHIAVVSSDLGAPGVPGCTASGDEGRLLAEAGCFTDGRTYLRHEILADATVITNYEGSVGDGAACLTVPSPDGCSVEQPLAAMRRALDGSQPSSGGFLRDGGYLYVAFITDEDDCSLTDGAAFAATADPDGDALATEAWSAMRCFAEGVRCDPDAPEVPGEKADCLPRPSSSSVAEVDDHVAFLRSLKDDPSLVIVGAVVGRGPVTVTSEGHAPACTSAAGANAMPAPRLAYLAAQFPQRNVTTTICNDSWADVVLLLADGFGEVIANPCVEGDIDLDAVTPGVQHECAVVERVYPEQPGEGSVIPPCASPSPDDRDRPCWRFEANLACETSSGLALVVERGPVAPPSAPSKVLVHCATRCPIPGGSAAEE
jgi:hypothetical protein